VDVDTFAELLSRDGRRLQAEVERCYDESDALALGTRLRRDHPPALVAAAVEQAQLRRRGAAKFGTDAARMYFTRDGLEQATAPPVAGYRLGRLTATGAASIADLCCGIGGDLVVAAGLVPAVTGADVDPLTCAIARANLEALGLAGSVIERDVESMSLDPYDALFADPARRDTRGRAWNRSDYRPGWDFVERVLRGTACVKTSPALPHAAVPPGTEAEWVSLDGQVREVCLWSPDLTSSDRRATVIAGRGEVDSITAADLPPEVPVRPMGRYVYDVDPAVTASHLVPAVAGLLDGWLVDEHIGYVCTDDPRSSPFARSYQVLDELPYPLKRLRAALRQRDIGALTIKKRGVDVEPARLRRDLGLRGSAEATLLLTRTPDGARAYLVD
jgi:hypothetical protein